MNAAHPPISAPSVSERLHAAVGPLGPGLQALTRKDPVFASALADYVEATTTASSLEPKIRELLLLAHDVSITNLDTAGATRRVVKALKAGATEREVRDVVELVVMLSLHGLTTGFPLLAAQIPPEAVTESELEGGYWRAFESAFPGFHTTMRTVNPTAFKAYRQLGQTLWRAGGLSPMWCELVFVVADLANTHLFSEGAAFHIANALHYGATYSQVFDAIFLTVPSIVRSIDSGFTALEDGLALYRHESDR